MTDWTLGCERLAAGAANLALLLCVTLTFVFTANVLLQKLLGSLLTDVHLRLGLALGLGGAGMAAVCLATSLGSEIRLSLKQCC